MNVKNAIILGGFISLLAISAIGLADESSVKKGTLYCSITDEAGKSIGKQIQPKITDYDDDFERGVLRADIFGLEVVFSNSFSYEMQKSVLRSVVYFYSGNIKVHKSNAREFSWSFMAPAGTELTLTCS